jgi:hypothetical protein
MLLSVMEELASALLKPHIDPVTTKLKKARKTRSSSLERPVIYRGIKIAPMSGKRSATAQAIRDALRTKSEQSRANATHG